MGDRADSAYHARVEKDLHARQVCDARSVVMLATLNRSIAAQVWHFIPLPNPLSHNTLFTQNFSSHIRVIILDTGLSRGGWVVCGG